MIRSGFFLILVNSGYYTHIRKAELMLFCITPCSASVFPIFVNSISTHPAANGKNKKQLEIILDSCLPSSPNPIFLTALTSRQSPNPSTSVRLLAPSPGVSCLNTCLLASFRSCSHIVYSSHSIEKEL